MKRAVSVFLFAVLMPLTVLAAVQTPAMTAQIASATPTRTEVTAEFDPQSIIARFSATSAEQDAAQGFNALLAVAGHGTPVAHVLSYELGDPVSAMLTLDNPPPDVAATPADIAVVDAPAILHDLRIVGLHLRTLARDESGVLRTVTRVRAEVVTGGAGINEKDDPTSLSSAFYDLYRAAVSNFDHVYPEMTTRAPGRYLVIGAQNRIDGLLQDDATFLPWLDLKKRKGYTMQVEGLTDVSNTSVRNFVRDAYNDPALPELEYAVIVGDAQGQGGEFPGFWQHNPEDPNESPYSAGDNLFFCVAGDDSLPDILYGRIAASTPTQYAVYFSKAYKYEAAPSLDDRSWFEKMACVAGNNGGNQNVFPTTPVMNMNWARDRMLREGGITQADSFYFHRLGPPLYETAGQKTSAIKDTINAGRCLVFYRGWAAADGWQYPIFTVSNAMNDVSNARRMPAFFSVVCGTANFANASQCLGEAFTTGYSATGSTPRNPCGGIIFFGATDIHTNTQHNNAMLSGIVEALNIYGIRSAGALALAGKLEGWRQYPLQRYGSGTAVGMTYYYTMHTFGLLGDPELQIFVGQPGDLAITVPAQIETGETLVPFTVTAGGQPVENAVVTLRSPDSSVVASDRTNAAGQVWLSTSLRGEGTADVTAWKSKYIMKREQIPVVNTSFNPKLAHVTWTAGADNLPYPGETADFVLWVKNSGDMTTTPSLTVTSLDTRVTVNTGTATAPSIIPGDSAQTSTFSISLTGEMNDGERPLLNVLITDGAYNSNRQMTVPVSAPDPVITAMIAADGNNGILESSDGTNPLPVSITIRNAGHQDGANLTAQVYSWDNAIVIDNNELSWDVAPVGQSTISTTNFTAHLAPGVTPGRQIVMRLVFSQSGQVIARKKFLLPTGVVTIRTPTGPDEYGYYAYEDIDTGFGANTAPTYNWIELDPAFQGTGATAHHTWDDSTFAMDLPDSFSYYGQRYGRIWVCSNGWFSFGPAITPDFRNYEFPSPQGPPAPVAPFWDDLLIDRYEPNNDSVWNVYTRYDPAEHRFIILWRCFGQRGLTGNPNMYFETFEAILEYPVTGTGDGSIVFQYDQVTNYTDDADDYTFWTVGMEDWQHTRGLNLMYASMYAPTVDTLRPGRAIRITTVPPDAFMGTVDKPQVLPLRFALHEAYPNPFNATTAIRFDLPTAARVELRVFNSLGQLVSTLIDENRAAGSHSVLWDASGVASGVYIYQLKAGSYSDSKKMVLMK
jgi:hypothetical protein